MITMIFFGVLALAILLWAIPRLFQANKLADEMDSWDAITYRYHMNTNTPGSNAEQQQNPMFWGQMYHPFEVMKQAYEMEERRRSSNTKQTFSLIVLLIVCVAATYLFRGLGII